MISTRLHGAIDYGVAATFAAAAAGGSFGRFARRVLGGAGAYHTAYALVTDYEAGVASLVTMRQHLALDAVAAAGLCAAGVFAQRQPPRDRMLLLAAGLLEFAVIAASDRTPSRERGRLLDASRGASRGQRDPAYRPLDTPKPVTEDVWIVDAGPLQMGAMPLPVRMTVIRLPDGGLLLHSPTQFSPRLKRALEELGPIRFLFAPNIAHWMFLRDWQVACPDATVLAPPKLRRRRPVRRSGLRVDADLTETAPAAWGGALQLVAVPGTGGFEEFAVFDKRTRTLLLTDLVLNLELDRLPPFTRPVARLLGVTEPDGRAPVYLRAVFKLGGRRTVDAARQLIDLAPERVIFAHGKWFEHNGTAALRRSLSWLRPSR